VQLHVSDACLSAVLDEVVQRESDRLRLR
jgi:hypothetical protein